MLNGEERLLGDTPTWNWQQGAMAQWWPTVSDEVVFNTMNHQCLGAKRVRLDGTVVKEYDYPIQALSPEGSGFISLNYRRLARLRPDYGYDVDVENFYADMPDDQDGLWLVNADTGEANLIITLEQLKRHQPREEMAGCQHKVNHVMFSPSGKRFVFMHRWTGKNGKFSRLYTANKDGSELYLLADERMISHYAWRDDGNLLAWARKNGEDHFYLFRDQSSHYEMVGKDILDVNGDGHPSYSPDRRWIVVDTYPGRDRKQSLFLYDTKNNKIHLIGRFLLPWKYRGVNRCDLHPRWSRDGLSIAIDSLHEGHRGLYTLDVSKVVIMAGS